MSCDLFSRNNALKLLKNKRVWLFGDSNMRCIYKDLVWLLEYGTLTSKQAMQLKGESSHARDKRLTDGRLHSGRDYQEERSYNRNGVECKYMFITRHYADNFVRQFVKCTKDFPDIVVINSGVWDLSRWGPNGAEQYRMNLRSTLELLTNTLPKSTRVIFTTTLPLSSKCKGGFLIKQIENLRFALPYHIVEANHYMVNTICEYRYDVLDLWQSLRFHEEELLDDGIHWSPKGYRFIVNVLLTHIALCDEAEMPCVFQVERGVIQHECLPKENVSIVAKQTSDKAQNREILKATRKLHKTIHAPNRTQTSLNLENNNENSVRSSNIVPSFCYEVNTDIIYETKKLSLTLAPIPYTTIMY